MSSLDESAQIRRASVPKAGELQMLVGQETSVGTLTWNQTLIAVGAVALTALLTGLIIIYGRSKEAPTERSSSIVRSWIALILVIGLVMFSAFTFGIADANLRSTLVGGLTASVGAAIAFYFSSRSSDQAREDILNATLGTESVPKLEGKTQAEATALLGTTSFKLEDAGQGPDAVIATQNPSAGSVARKGTPIAVTLNE
jgi:PASTA domain